MTRLKVLHLITTLPRLSGAADNTRYTVNLLDPGRYEVHLAAGSSPFDASRVARHVRTEMLPHLGRPLSPVRDALATRELRRLLRRERYDIVHTHNSKAGILGRVAARLAGVPVVVHTAHTISWVASGVAPVNGAYLWAERACAPLCDKIITVSEANRARYMAARVGRPEQYVTVYSGVETQAYLSGAEREGFRREVSAGPQTRVVVWLGRLNRQKDPLTYVRACRLLADRLPDVRFLLVGEDSVGESLDPEVRRLVDDLHLTSTFTLLGYRADVPRILAGADLVMHSSLYEGLGRSIVEAMLAGVPLAATAVDGVCEAVVSGERGGLLVAPGDPAALADAATRLMAEPDLAARVTAAGRRWALERFDVGTMVTTIDELYQQLWHQVTRGSRA